MNLTKQNSVVFIAERSIERLGDSIERGNTLSAFGQ